MRCSDISILLAESEGQSDRLRPLAREHVRSCLRCQAEAANFRRLLKGMRSLRYQPVAYDASHCDKVLELVSPLAEVHPLKPKSRRRAYISGFAAAATAGAAGALVIASRLAAKQNLAS